MTERYGWHLWFAWRPVRIGRRWRWLVPVWRCTATNDHKCSQTHESWTEYWEYRS